MSVFEWGLSAFDVHADSTLLMDDVPHADCVWELDGLVLADSGLLMCSLSLMI